MVYIPVGFSEAISYTPILGASSYLTFITGNIMNLKLPCAVNAMKLAKKLAIHMTDVLKCDGFNLVQNNHEVAGQTVFHFHMHLIPRYLNAKNNDILNWSHETFSPEEMAEIRDSLKMES
jgi:diadenosine tetraphosphate (Ap4A) HIT family hydrolase